MVPLKKQINSGPKEDITQTEGNDSNFIDAAIYTNPKHEKPFNLPTLNTKKVESISNPKEKSIVTRTVKPGENLSYIAGEAYGSQSPKYLEWVKLHNPQIVDPHIILPGQQIVLPEYTKDKASQ